MTWLIGLGIFILGLAVGFIAAKLLLVPEANKQVLAEHLAESQQAQDSLKNELATYLVTVQSSFEQLSEQAKKAAEQAQTYNDKLAKAGEEEEIIPYFGKETSEELRNTQRNIPLSKQLEKTDANNAPLDYSEGSSGLLEGEKSS